MKRKAALPILFSVCFVSLLALISPYSCSKKDPAPLPKTKKETRYTTVDYFDVDCSRTIKINDAVYTYVNGNIKWVHELYLNKNYTSVQNFASELLKNQDEDNSGNLASLYAGLGKITDDRHIALMHSVLNEWCDKEPNSHIPFTVRGLFYINWAWSIRGTGYAKDVPEDAWPAFYGKLELAKKDLDRSFALNPNDPNSSRLSMLVARGMGYPEEVKEQYYQNGVKACPWHLGLHVERLQNLMPKWGGSLEEMFKFANVCLKQSERYPFLGLIMADAYYEQWQELEGKEEILARKEVWEEIESIYTNVLNKYPDGVGLRLSYARMAFVADRNDIALQQLEIVGDRWTDGTEWRTLESYNSSRAHIYYRGGYDLLSKKKCKESIDHLLTSIRCKPTVNAYYALGEAYFMLSGNPPRDTAMLSKAEEAYEKALAMAPDNKRIERAVRMTKGLIEIRSKGEQAKGQGHP